MNDFEYVNLEDLEPNYTVYQENILLIGFIGTGKTTMAQDILDGLPNAQVYAWDAQNKFSKYGLNVRTLQDFKDPNQSYILNPISQSQKYFDAYFEMIYNNAIKGLLKNKVCITDELQKFTNPRELDSPLFKVVTSCRNQSISHIFITPSPAYIPKYIKEHVAHVFSFMMNDYDHVKYMQKNFFGKSAWLTMSPDKRDYYQDEPMLTEHSFIYRNQKEQITKVVNF